MKNVIYSSEKFYNEYCLSIKQNMFDFFQVLKYQSKHTWSCFYWYKNNESHYKHIDHYGEFAAFLILSQLNDDYNEGGLYFEKGSSTIYLDELYEYGDLVFFDQENYYHEVKKIYTNDEQVGRLQFYIPTIPYAYMKPYLRFEDYPFDIKFSMDLNNYEKILNYFKGMFEIKRHYSRKNFFKYFLI